jgi:hypothetical protein
MIYQFLTVFQILIRMGSESIGSVDPDPDPNRESGSSNAKMTHKKRIK